MKRIDLVKIEHPYKTGEICPNKKPTVTEDCVLYSDGVPIGFFFRQMPDKMIKLAELANQELNSTRVPKTMMSRLKADGYDENGKAQYKDAVRQHSVIIGSIPPKEHMRRPYATISSVHGKKSARNFIKAMLMLAGEAEKMIAEILPEQHKKQIELFKQVPEKWRFGNIFTSSISNYNISAPFHRDAANILQTVNVIITKRANANGGDLFVPDYDAVFDQCDNSILVYPAWRNMHAVTPIEPTYQNGYRNSLVFYPLKAFVGRED